MTSLERFHDFQGCRLSYRIDGAGSRVLFIQGTGVHGAAWRPQIEVLSESFSCLSFDNRGIGHSMPRGGKITIRQMASDALALMDASGWTDAHIVGHSLGGIVAQELALQSHERARSLALLCTFSRGRDAMQVSPWMMWTGLRSRIGTRSMRRAAFLKLMMTPDELAHVDVESVAESLAPLFGHDLADQPPVMIPQMRAMSAYDATPRLGELSHIPTLVVSAALDRISPPWVGRKMARDIAGARYVEIPKAAHGVPLSQAGVVNDLLREHFDSSEARRSPQVSEGFPYPASGTGDL